MAAANDTVRDRIGSARVELTPLQVGAGLALVVALVFTLLFVQDPMVHDSMHSFRHAAGITCH